MKAEDVAKIRLTITPIGKWDHSRESDEAKYRAAMVAKQNAMAAEWAKDKPEWPGVNFARGVLILLEDGSACHVTADHLNMMAEHYGWYREGREAVALREDLIFAFNRPSIPMEFAYVAAGTYPSKLYGCPVIAVGLR